MIKLVTSTVAAMKPLVANVYLAAFSKPQEWSDLMGTVSWIISTGMFPFGVVLIAQAAKSFDRGEEAWGKLIGGIIMAAALPLMGVFYVMAGMGSAKPNY